MKKICNRNWIGENLDTLKFFAQLTEDLLFDFNLISYKVKLLNTHYICEEFLFFYDMINNGTIYKNSHNSIIDELIFSLENDLIVDSALNGQRNIFIQKIKGANYNLQKLKVIITLIKEMLDDNYLIFLEKRIIEIVRENDFKKKEEIMFLTQTYLTELINLGYSKRLIYMRNKYLFFSSEKVDSSNQITKFIDYFSKEKKKYKVLFILRADKDIIASLKPTVFQTFAKLPKSCLGHKDKFSEKDCIYLETPEISAYDQFSAKEFAEKHINNLESLLNYSNHKYSIEFSSDALVVEEKTKKVFLVNAGAKGIFKRPDKNKVTKNSQRVYNVLSKLKGGDLWPVIIAHSDAMKSENIKHQFITLWSGIESILLDSTEKNKKFTDIWNYFSPLFTLSYFRNYCSYLHNYLMRCYSTKYKIVLSKVKGGETNFDKCILLLSMFKENEKLRDELYEEIAKDNLLLVNKIHCLVNTLKDMKNIRNSLEKHLKYVFWQFQRIYRTRNLIVHTNQKLPYIDNLLENLHDYFDKIVEDLLRCSENNNSIKNIEGLIMKLSLDSETYRKLLKNSVSLDKNNFRKLILNDF